mgnify:CR=1 FL=1
MNEAETRAEHIDPALKAAGWGVVEGSRIRPGQEFASDARPGKGWEPLDASDPAPAAIEPPAAPIPAEPSPAPEQPPCPAKACGQRS